MRSHPADYTLCRGPQGPRGLKFGQIFGSNFIVTRRGPQGPRGLKSAAAAELSGKATVAVRKDRED